MADKPSTSKKIWAAVGQVAVVLTVIWTAYQIYANFVTRDVNVEATGTCQNFSVPTQYQKQLGERLQIPPDEEIKNALPDDLKDKDSVVPRVRNLFSNQKSRLDKALIDFNDLRASCKFTVSNNGYKEALDIKLEIPRRGVFTLEKLGEPRVDDKFDQIISIGKLNPGGEATVTTWNTDYMPDISPWEEEKFRVTHTSGLSRIQFLPRNTTLLGEIYESYPNTVFIILVVIMVGMLVIGWFSGINDERKKKIPKGQEKPSDRTADETEPNLITEPKQANPEADVKTGATSDRPKQESIPQEK